MNRQVAVFDPVTVTEALLSPPSFTTSHNSNTSAARRLEFFPWARLRARYGGAGGYSRRACALCAAAGICWGLKMLENKATRGSL